MRVFVGPIEIAGYYSNLTRGFRSIGVDCDFYTFHHHPFNYGGETSKPKILRLADWFNRFRGNSKRSIFMRFLLAIPGEILRHIWGLIAIFKYDVFIFGYGISLFRGNVDLILIHWLNKKIISNLGYGSECRPPYIDGFFMSKYRAKHSTNKICSSVVDLRKRQERHEKYATIVIGAPFSTSYFSRSLLLNWFALGIPINLNLPHSENLYSEKIYKLENQKKIRILHSPSNPEAKGTELIKHTIEKLKNRGYELDFVLIQGKKFQEVLIEIKNCDFVIDQIYSDTPMAGFATEAAWFGKPAVVGGYGLELLREFVPEGMWPPSKICKPDNIEQAIEDLIINKDERENLGRDALRFVHEKWNAKEVAKRYLRIIEGDVPNEWIFDPNDVCYLEGACQPRERTKAIVREMVEKHGVESLQLSHRPDLEKAFLDFANLRKEQT